MAPHSGKVCVKMILKLDVTIAGLLYSSVTVRLAVIPGYRIEMVESHLQLVLDHTLGTALVFTYTVLR